MGLSISVGHLADLIHYDEDIPSEPLVSKAISALQRLIGGDAGDPASFRATMARLNRELRAAGLPEHREPEQLEDGFSSAMWGYSGLHFLRRIAAYDALGHPLPDPGPNDLPPDAIVDLYYQRAKNDKTLHYRHLMLHSDAEGFYLPTDFPDVLPCRDRALGEVGSAPRLRAECLQLAALIGAPPDADPWSNKMQEAIEHQGQGEGWRRYGREAHACLVLLQACDASIRTGAVIVFC